MGKKLLLALVLMVLVLFVVLGCRDRIGPSHPFVTAVMGLAEETGYTCHETFDEKHYACTSHLLSMINEDFGNCLAKQRDTLLEERAAIIGLCEDHYANPQNYFDPNMQAYCALFYHNGKVIEVNENDLVLAPYACFRHQYNDRDFQFDVVKALDGCGVCRKRVVIGDMK